MKNKKGFTLLEIMFVLAIVAILLLVAAPIMTNFVGTSKTKSADTIAASIYTIADNLIYNDTIIQKNDSYGCKNGCEFDSNTTNSKYKKLSDAIKSEYPGYKGEFQLKYQAGGGLQIKYYYKTIAGSTIQDGIYPETLGSSVGTSGTGSKLVTKVSN